MPQYKLTYFNGRGRAEVLRLIFAYAGVPYEDIRIESEQWPKLKPTLPFGQIPVLEVDGKVLSQSAAIGRYLAGQFGLTGKDAYEAACCDALVDGIADLATKMAPFFAEREPEKKKQLHQELRESTLRPFGTRYEKFLKDNGTGYFVGNQLTWADLAVFNIMTTLWMDILNEYPTLSDFVKRINDLPKIKAWIEKRPNTPF